MQNRGLIFGIHPRPFQTGFLSRVRVTGVLDSTNRLDDTAINQFIFNSGIVATEVICQRMKNEFVLGIADLPARVRGGSVFDR
jgi:hypothetical protein